MTSMLTITLLTTDAQAQKDGGLVGPREEALAEKTKSIGSYVKENDIPLTQVRDGVTYYLTTGSESE